jgi:hypothetical protein
MLESLAKIISSHSIGLVLSASALLFTTVSVADAAADSVYVVQIQTGWRASVSFSPPGGWIRQQGPDAVWYVVQGLPIGACSLIFPPPESSTVIDSATAFRDWHNSSVKSGRILNQTELAWGTSSSSNSTTWRMQGAELRLPNGTPTTVLSYIGESKSVRQKAVYQCIGVGASGTQYAGPNAQHLPSAIMALKSVALDVFKGQPATRLSESDRSKSFQEMYQRQQSEHDYVMRLQQQLNQYTPRGW